MGLECNYCQIKPTIPALPLIILIPKLPRISTSKSTNFTFEPRTIVFPYIILAVLTAAFPSSCGLSKRAQTAAKEVVVDTDVAAGNW